MREKGTRKNTDNEKEKENVLGIVVGKRQCVSNMGRARALCWITIIGYWNLRPQVATAQEMIRKGKYWLQENQDEQIWKQLFSKGVWFLMDRTTNPYGRKTYEGPKLLKSNVCTLIHDFHQNREWVILTEYAYNGSLPAYHLVCLSTFSHLSSIHMRGKARLIACTGPGQRCEHNCCFQSLLIFWFFAFFHHDLWVILKQKVQDLCVNFYQIVSQSFLPSM